MELVAAADSDERGLSLLRIWNTLRSIVLPHITSWIQQLFSKQSLDRDTQHSANVGDSKPSIEVQDNNSEFEEIEEEEELVSEEVTDSEEILESEEIEEEEEVSSSEKEIDTNIEEKLVFIRQPTSKSQPEMPTPTSEEINQKVSVLQFNR